MLVEQIVSY